MIGRGRKGDEWVLGGRQVRKGKAVQRGGEREGERDGEGRVSG